MFGFLRPGDSAALHRLGKSALFAGLTLNELKIVEGFTHDRHFLPGEVVFDEGEVGQALYVIVSGSVLICRQGQADRPIARLLGGNFFGELALLDDSPRSAQARALERTEIAVLFRGDFERLLQSHAHIASQIAMALARHLGRRLRQMVASDGAEA
ncbi:MAG: cyclic nucleotide-binding domain-containing protein [Betaproteobacteria bacterium]|jgi:CRP-like cAMP-binding protein|nr:cyclic nucleotide-binding domain-containing protein [Betaproteobacteria bacterium]HMV19904.1 cyclic nucleotide-binding domain-containing protein [Rhodocyclaceae bacterium]HNL20938.1 cyclic nucleotide-binding domain-containing protein [Rhodocyclaceae bacterium]HNM79892.1 cyclic nucleotide-binding domain-containing protein [Rhodocyclaceae bacterium]HNP03303.1 cyclic nucleotide-binding domain-containing protein [Rhodocyclaceae bacterium]